MRTFVVAASVLALVAGERVARASEDSGTLGANPHMYESPQHFELEFRFAPYYPRIDANPELNGNPYATTFDSKPILELAAEFDWQAVRIPHLGTFGPGLSIGYTSNSTQAPLTDNPSQRSAETTSIDILPLYLVGVLRADVLMRDYHIPLVPYAKLGIGYALWHATNSVRGTSVALSDPNNPASPTVIGEGHTLGAQAAIGVAVHLNPFDRGASVDLDNSIGINHTYLFGEYMVSELTGIAQSHALWVGTRTWVVGLAFEF